MPPAKPTPAPMQNDGRDILYDSADPMATPFLESFMSGDGVFTADDVRTMLGVYQRFLIFGDTPPASVRGPHLKHRMGRKQVKHDVSTANKRTIVSRVIASTWVVDPGVFGGTSLKKVGDLPHVNESRFALAKHARRFSRRFGIASRGLKSMTACRNMRAAALRRWDKVRASLPPAP